jgi:hypothetical protein
MQPHIIRELNPRNHTLLIHPATDFGDLALCFTAPSRLDDLLLLVVPVGAVDNKVGVELCWANP